MNIEEKLISLITSLEPSAPNEMLSQARQDAGYGEYGVALENLCEQLFEMKVNLDQTQFAAISELADEMSLPEDRWKFVQEFSTSVDDESE